MRLLGEAGTTVVALGLSFAVAACAPVEGGFNLSKARDAAAAVSGSEMAGNDELFTIDGITYSTQDVADYDEVGYATLGGDDEVASNDLAAIAHRTLPIGSAVEITALDSGLRLQARIQSRGPMVNSRLIAVPSKVMARLGMEEGGAVRVQRVYGSDSASAIAQPAVLDILQRSLPTIGSVSLRAEDNAAIARALTQVDDAQGGEYTDNAAIRLAHRHPRAAPAARASLNGNYDSGEAEPAKAIVKTGEFSSKVTAERVARDLGAEVKAYGRNWRVVSDKLANSGQAEAALAKVRGAGYRDAQIYTVQ